MTSKASTRTVLEAQDPKAKVAVHLLDVGREEYGDAVLCQLGKFAALIDGAHGGNWKAEGGHPAVQDQVAKLLGQAGSPVVRAASRGAQAGPQAVRAAGRSPATSRSSSSAPRRPARRCSARLSQGASGRRPSRRDPRPSGAPRPRSWTRRTGWVFITEAACRGRCATCGSRTGRAWRRPTCPPSRRAPRPRRGTSSLRRPEPPSTPMV